MDRTTCQLTMKRLPHDHAHPVRTQPPRAALERTALPLHLPIRQKNGGKDILRIGHRPGAGITCCSGLIYRACARRGWNTTRRTWSGDYIFIQTTACYLPTLRHAAGGGQRGLPVLLHQEGWARRDAARPRRAVGSLKHCLSIPGRGPAPHAGGEPLNHPAEHPAYRRSFDDHALQPCQAHRRWTTTCSSRPTACPHTIS